MPEGVCRLTKGGGEPEDCLDGVIDKKSSRLGEEGNAGGLSRSITLGCLDSTSRGRFPSIELGESVGDRVFSAGVSVTATRGSASSTSVASVSLEESVLPLLSASSSSSSLEVTSASFARSIVGVMAASSANSR